MKRRDVVRLISATQSISAVALSMQMHPLTPREQCEVEKLLAACNELARLLETRLENA